MKFARNLGMQILLLSNGLAMFGAFFKVLYLSSKHAPIQRRKTVQK
jgi:hypothetical protein